MQPSKNSELSRADFDEFINVFTHEIRNRLNAVSLEVADLSEQGGVDAARLEQRVRDCAAYLKTVRELVTPDDPAAPRHSLAEIVAKLRSRPSA